MNTRMKFAKELVPFLGTMLGENGEVVLQDIIQQKIVAISNGNVSGRREGSPLTDYALKMIAKEEWKKSDCQTNYFGKTKDGRVLRSSTFFIKDNERLIGMLCINIDVSKYKELGNELLKFAGMSDMLKGTLPDNEALMVEAGHMEEAQIPLENFAVSLPEMVSATVQKELPKYGVMEISRLSKEEKLEIIAKLNAEGVFLVKGAIGIAAQELDCSESTMYRYLSKISK